MPGSTGLVVEVTAQSTQVLSSAADSTLIYNLDPDRIVYLSSVRGTTVGSRIPLAPGKQIIWPPGTPCYGMCENVGFKTANLLVLEGGGGMQPSAQEIAEQIGAAAFSGSVDVSNFVELQGPALDTLTDVVNAINGAGGVARNVHVDNFPGTQPISEAHLANLNITLSALRDAIVTGLGRPAGAVPHFDAHRITTNTTYTVTAADAYLQTLALAVSDAGAGWMIKVQNREGTAKQLQPATAAAVGLVVLRFDMPVLMSSGIDIVTAGGGPAGTVDVFTSYYS